eukprot:TRINITY_DN60065_c0_g1_i1.p1 TRINITY_DN60065_c0_g1~~TRINITY_DN60065_c0_g1_i1.p1  ORF type:complete len:345 (-),score=43.15 TRINITY_DN60065_c0_g1_i1:47-1081(-)
MRSVAICIAGLLRTLPDVAESIQKFLVGPLDADLFISGPLEATGDWISALANFPTLAQVRLERENVTRFLTSSKGDGWRNTVHIKGNWLGCYEGDEDRNTMRRWGAGLCLIYSQKQCLDMITDWESKRGKQFERVIFSRPHFRWVGPHIPLRYLNSTQIWVVDGEDNGGINDRHWVIPRDVMPIMLGAWDMLVDGRVAAMLRGIELPWLHAELFFGILIMRNGLQERMQRFPVLGYLLCKSFADRLELKEVTPTNLDILKLGETEAGKGVRCQAGGPKYKREYLFATEVLECKGQDEWDWFVLWQCWCSAKVRSGVLAYSEYNICRTAVDVGLTRGLISVNGAR